MENINLQNYKKIYFIGIGGISMSGIAEILHNKGHIICGSDANKSEITEHIQKVGMNVFVGHTYENIPEDFDLVVHTSAIKMDNPEIISAKDKNIKIIDRALLLGALMKNYKFPICISGTHGKTTTTSMLSEVFLQAKTDPTIMLGGILNSIKNNYRVGNGSYFIAESCEYYDSFLKFYAHTAIILNVDLDHLDYFKNLSQIEGSFNNFAKNIYENGFLVINNNIKNIDRILNEVNCKVVTYGNEEADYFSGNIEFNEEGFPSYDVINNNKILCRINLNVRGLHNIDNSLSVFVASLCNGLDIKEICQGLYNFKGVNRRYELKGIYKGITIVDDYAHHPTEVIATLKSARNTKGVNKIFVVFQPHTYTRTKELLDEFAKSFDEADEVLIVDIYSAREVDNKTIHAKDLVEKINMLVDKSTYFKDFKTCEHYIKQKCTNNDLLITMGAGNVYMIGENILNIK